MGNVERTLVKAFMEIAIAIDLTDDDDIDPDVATDLLEPVAALLQEMPSADRRHLADLLLACAEEETLPERRTTALDLPESLGLI
ncbi:MULTISPECIES: hypothetical protein [unclassified Spirillospora]|uniref:hypothetical protein n=1 Tax=unclassified Spirillospora TaxID=2642701 RepID=UPI003717097A